MIVGKTDGLPHNEFLVSQLSLTDFRFKCDVLLKDNQGTAGSRSAVPRSPTAK